MTVVSFGNALALIARECVYGQPSIGCDGVQDHRSNRHMLLIV